MSINMICILTRSCKRQATLIVNRRQHPVRQRQQLSNPKSCFIRGVMSLIFSLGSRVTRCPSLGGMFRLLGALKHVLPSEHKFVNIPVFRLKKCYIQQFFYFWRDFLSGSTYYREYRGQEKKLAKTYATRNTKNRARLYLRPRPTAGPKWAAQAVLLAKVYRVQLPSGNTYCLYVKLR
jgi:hypothetical protein